MSKHFALLAWLALLPLASAGTNAVVRPFFAYCVELGAPGVTPRPLAAQAALLRELGYDGMGVELGLDAGFTNTLRTLDEAGVALHMVWTTVNVNPAKGPAFSAQLPEAIRRLAGRPVAVAVLLAGLPPGDPAGLEPAVAALRQLGDCAAGAKARVSIYNHVGNWAASLPFAIEVVRQAKHPQVGFNFNLCHWLKVDGRLDYRPLLRDNVAKLFCVTLNGAQTNATTWTHGLIQPLDKGDFDNRALLGLLEEIGYRQPVGLMCYGVPDEARAHLARSMAAWRALNTAPLQEQARRDPPPAAGGP